MITSAMRLNETDLDGIGNMKAHTHKGGGTIAAVLENGLVAIVQGYAAAVAKHNNKVRIDDCLPTCIKVRDLSGLAKAHYGHYPDFA